MSDNQWCEQTEKGLIITGMPTLEEFGNFGATLNRIHNALPRMLGDWFNFGINEFGEAIYQVIDDLGYKKETIWNYASIYRRIPLKNRDPDLSHTHHTQIAKLPSDEQVEWLAKAKYDPDEERPLTAAELGRKIKGEPINGDSFNIYLSRAVKAMERVLDRSGNQDDETLGWLFTSKKFLDKCQKKLEDENG